MYDKSLEDGVREQEVLLNMYAKYSGDSSTPISRSSIRTPKKKILFTIDFNYKTGKCTYKLKK